MKRVLVLMLCVVFFSLVACSGAPSNSNASVSPSVDPSSNVSVLPSTTPIPEETEDLSSATGIPGSHYTDIVLNMEQFGLTDHSYVAAPEEAKAYYDHSATSFTTNLDLDADLDYSLTIDADYQIISATFGINWAAYMDNTDFVSSAKTYLGFAATIPYDTSDSNSAKTWVQENIPSVADGESVSSTFGDAKYELYGTSTNGNYTSFWLDISVAE